MFTGIVTGHATLVSREQRDSGARFRFRLASHHLARLKEGDSISVSGVCLTAVDITADEFNADVSTETLHKTTLQTWATGSVANIELPLKLEDRLGGHMVSGHVDARTRLISRQREQDSWVFRFELPQNLARFVARKGSVCLDGVSLTVNEVTPDSFSVCIIPHTLDVTTFGALLPGQEANMEIDLIARYLERLQSQQESSLQ